MWVQTQKSELQKNYLLRVFQTSLHVFFHLSPQCKNAVLLLEHVWNFLSSVQTEDVIIVGEREGIIEENLLRLDNNEDYISTN